MASWKETLELGMKFEESCVLKLRETTQPKAYLNVIKESFPYYDIVLPDIEKFLECKFDKEASESSNICIEVGCNGRLSGLLVTKADYWLIADGNEAFLIEASRIKECIMDNPNISYRKNYPVTQEDGFVKDMNFFLIPKRIFRKYCCENELIDNMTFKNLK